MSDHFKDLDPGSVWERVLVPVLSGLSTWGLWPALVMVLCQLEASQLLDASLPRHVVLLTLSGVFTIYGADRFLERRLQANTESRHRGHLLASGLFLVVIPLCLALAVPHMTRLDFIWLCILGVAGALYLPVTLNLLASFPGFKEVLGAFCFTFLIWGRFPLDVDYVTAFSLMGFSNFLWSGFQDMVRDFENGVPSLALTHPSLTLAGARLCAMVAAGAFYRISGFYSVFFWVSILHGLWPEGEDAPVDLAFFPLLVVPFTLQVGSG